MATRRRCIARFRILLLTTTLVTVALFAGRTPAAAQLVSGTVIDESSEQPIAGAAIELTDTLGLARGSVVADTAGAFRIMVPQPGKYRLRVSHIAYASTETGTIDAALGVEVKLELRMSPSAVPLEPLRVVGRSEFNAGWLQEYYDRAMMTRRSGVGRVFFRDEVERANVPAVSWFMTYLQPRGRCNPTILLDGLEVEDVRQLDAMLQPFALEGVELYNNRAFLPPRYANRGYCALAMFWTRRDIEGGRPFTWKRLLAAAGLLAGILLLVQ
ncbi:MAG TPA: carboxypeptidase-like regulatory domain-containing protein [Longimicrobiales bacterium]|nr:carboxypeptidase-like regulatory domain-containing protein [Longimicrobiales bacterium]